MNRGVKISILGAGRVGSAVAHTLAVQGVASEIILVDGYVTTDTLDMLSKKNAGVKVMIITYPSAQI